MINSFLTLYKHSSSTFVEKKSKFICNIFPIQTEEEALQYIKKTKKQYFDATHNVFAYRLLNNIEKQSDDKEPKNTAGSPILEILKKENIQNILVIVTRYYGGTPLGKGGLIKAYSTSLKITLKNPTLITKYLMENVIIISSYDYYKKINSTIIKENHVLENTIYENNVTFITFIKYDCVNNFINVIINITNNNVTIKRNHKIYGFFINNKFYK